MHFLLPIIILVTYSLYLMPLYANASCPSGLTKVGENICVLKISRSVGYRQAHAICEGKGLERGERLFVPGLHAPQIARHFSNTLRFFTSITAFLNRSSNPRAGWQVGDPGHAAFISTATDSSIPWGEGEPNSYGPAIAQYQNAYLRDVLQNGMNCLDVVCELSTRPIDETKEKFKMNWPHQITNMFLSDTSGQGCFTTSNAASPLACAYRCKLKPVCRSFYFHKESGKCMLSLYIDSLLPNDLENSGGNWLRFGRPDW